MPKSIDKEKLSDEAQSFVENLQIIQDDFAKFLAGQVLIINKKGELVTRPSTPQRVCQDYIQKTKLGNIGCANLIGTAVELLKFQKDPIFMKCPANYTAFWIPIKLKGEVVGGMAACGGLFEEGKSKEGYRQEFSHLADLFGIKKDDNYFKLAIDDVKMIDQKELQKRAKRSASLIETLVEERAFKEVFQ